MKITFSVSDVFRVTVEHGSNKCSSGKLFTMEFGDDGNWFDAHSYDSHWIREIISALEAAERQMQVKE